MKKLILATVMTLAGAGQAIAGPYTTPTSNNVLGQVNGYLGANLFLVGGPADIYIEFLGKEAGATNTFTFNGDLLKSTGAGGQVGPLNTALNPPEHLGTYNGVASGLLSFSFATNYPVVPSSVSNGSNVLPHPSDATLTKPNFFVSLGPAGTGWNGFWGAGVANPTAGTSAILAFDDSGAGSDDNHDDLVIRLTIVGGPGTFATPDGGATVALLGGALLALGAARRRFGH